jgi:hypothetical protein
MKDLIKDEHGQVDWRANIPDEFLYPNKGWFEARNKPVPKSVEGLKDHQLLIKLGGIKYAAKLRGYRSCRTTIPYNATYPEVHCVAICEIEWSDNAVLGEQATIQSDVASVTPNNCDSFSLKFAESVATNRAFVRAVRNYLQINIVGDDEINKAPNKAENFTTSDPTPQGVLAATAKEKGFSDFDNLKNWVSDSASITKAIKQSLPNWNSYKDVDPKSARVILGALNS